MSISTSFMQVLAVEEAKGQFTPEVAYRWTLKLLKTQLIRWNLPDAMKSICRLVYGEKNESEGEPAHLWSMTITWLVME